MTGAKANAAKIGLPECLALVRDALDADPLLPDRISERDIAVRIQSATDRHPATYLATKGALTDLTLMAIGAVVGATRPFGITKSELKDGKVAIVGQVAKIAIASVASATLRTARYATPQAEMRRTAAQGRLAAFCEGIGHKGLAKGLRSQGIRKIS